MKILIGIIGILIVFVPHLAFGCDSDVVLEVSFNIQSLNESKLSDSDLSNIVGRGIEVSLHGGIDENNTKIILWDEAQSANGDGAYRPALGTSRRTSSLSKAGNSKKKEVVNLIVQGLNPNKI